MHIFEVTFQHSREKEIIDHQEYYTAMSFIDVYEYVKFQDQKDFELISIKRLVPVLKNIESNNGLDETT